MKRVTAIPLLVVALSIMNAQVPKAHAVGFTANKQQDAQRLADPTDAPRCDIAETKEITISCDYVVDAARAMGDKDEPRIVLNHAAFSFKTNDENNMRVELTFTNAGTNRTSEARSVYLAIDDESGRNYVRRILPHVDFRSLEPGQQLKFSERVLIPALQHGRYTINLWVPDPDPAFKFKVERNFLLDSAGVPDGKNGLNKVATFTVRP